ncbi:hypothetical protein OPQ81_006391 [Rhizoctonia solani]|nr:hypothetical protein OPQ81_006391 [Rhizoctonia solani]
MSSKPSPKLTLPIELLASIFELVSPGYLAVLMRCSRCFHEICNPLLYRQVHLHTPTQLVALLESPNARKMLGATTSLVVDDFTLYLEAWDMLNIRETSNPLHYLLRVLHTTTSLLSLKIDQSYASIRFSRRVDWSEESDHTSELSSAAGDPEFLPNLTLISVFHPAATAKSWFEALCYGRVIECYSIWNNTNLHAKIFPGLERSDKTLPGPYLSPSAISRLTSYPNGHISGRYVGRLICQSLDFEGRSNLTHFGLQLHLPDVVLHGKPSPIHNTFHWLKDVLSMLGLSQLQVLHVRFKSLPLDWTVSLEAQRLGLEELQTIVPALVGVGVSSTRMFWKRWVPEPGDSPSYSTAPHWTPCPAVDHGSSIDVRSVLSWWLNALGLDTSEMHNRTILKNMAKELSIAMHERWGFVAPAESTLYDRLLGHFLLVGPSHA